MKSIFTWPMKEVSITSSSGLGQSYRDFDSPEDFMDWLAEQDRIIIFCGKENFSIEIYDGWRE